MRTINLFYKRIIDIGGAERLLLAEYKQIKTLGLPVKIVSYQVNKEALFEEDIPEEDLITFKSRFSFISMMKFAFFMMRKRSEIFLTASGHIDTYIASLFSFASYYLHIHHPSFMSFNEYDKYSIFQSQYFNECTESNFGAQRFHEIRNSLSFLQLIKINLRAFISIKAIQKAKESFVLSDYAKKEKAKLFGIKSTVLQGAIEKNLLQNPPVDNNRSLFKEDAKYKILTIARLDINKRIDVLLKSFSIFLEKNPDSVLYIGGNGPEKAELESLANTLNISHSVKFLGFVQDSDLFQYYYEADLFASIDWADYRITAFESLAMNTKVLLSDETSYPKYLEDSGYLFISPPTIDATAKMLEKSLRQRPSISFDELKKYLDCVTWETYVSDIVKHISK